ncbi:hypothetical protein [Micromonospora okii]|uniref:hypothetical protein n=1 Tax=Micromonospora okii TaxID=1182970 RepID=UPI001E448133|nr:hypothetical protein [Micromonospora okii]
MSELVSAIPTLAATDVPSTMAFWVNRLGFRVSFSVDGFAAVVRDRVKLYIRAGSADAVAETWIAVRGLDELHAEWSGRLPCLIEAGVEPGLSPIGRQLWGRECLLRDRAGNLIHVIEEPAS